MRYLIPKFDCCLLGENKKILKENVQYKCENVDNNFVVIGENCELPFVFNFASSKNVNLVKHKQNEYYFLFAKTVEDLNTFQIKHQNKNIFISISTCCQFPLMEM